MSTYTSSAVAVAELTVGEFKLMIEETVENKLLEMLGDPDEGLDLRERVQARLRQTMEAERQGTKPIPAKEAAARLGLEW